VPETSTEVVSGPFLPAHESIGLIAYVVHLSVSARRASATLGSSARTQTEKLDINFNDYVDQWRIGDPYQNYIDYRSPMPGSDVISLAGHGRFWEGPGVVYYAQ
jgi:hypothetical protein